MLFKILTRYQRKHIVGTRVSSTRGVASVKVVLWLYNLLIRVPNRDHDTFLSDPYESNVIDMRISAPVSTII